MGIETAIAWTKSTFNPWQGCTKVGPGRDNCYAAAADQRFHKGIHWGTGAPRKTMSESTWNNPLRWNRDAAKTGEFWPVFCASHADVFDNEADPALRARLFKIIRETPYLTWQLLTKRTGNVAAMLPADWGDGYPNVWLGATFVNQAELNRDYRKLVSTSAVKRLASIEPMLAAMHLRRIRIRVDGEIDALTGEEFSTAHLTRRFVRYWPALDWVIAGGESGVGARVAHPTCIAASVTIARPQAPRSCSNNGERIVPQRALLRQAHIRSLPAIEKKSTRRDTLLTVFRT